MKLAPRLVVYLLTIIAVLVAAITAIVDNRLHQSVTVELEASLEREARFIAARWQEGAAPEKLSMLAGRSLELRVTLIDSAGFVAGESQVKDDGPRNLLFQPELIDARRTGLGVVRRPNPTNGHDDLYVAVKAGTGFSRVAISSMNIDRIFDQARRDILFAGLVALAAALVLALHFARRVSQPINEVRDVIRALSERDFRPRRIASAPGEVGELAASLNHLSTRLEALESVRRDFVANVSHELRTPLTVVGGFAETLASDDPPNAMRREFAGMILESTHRMQRIVDDLLDLSRIESGGWIPKPERLKLTDVVPEVLTPLEPAATRKGLAIRTYLPDNADTVWADRTAIRQILSNLVENAIRHTSTGTITVFSEASSPGVWIGVRDTGEGISEEHISRIFERFYRVDSGRSREAGGTGLGLAIVRHLTEAHSGRVRASSRLGEGTSIGAYFPPGELRPARKA
ncbi:MAG: ATP-binding protein [Gemmatimonadaceae bacterium]